MMRHANTRQLTLANCPDFLTVSQVQELLQLSQAGSYNLFHREDFPAINIVGRMMVSKANFLAWIENNTRSG